MALVWPPAGIALAAILLFGYRFWPGVVFGAVLLSFMNGLPLGVFTLGTVIGNTIGAIACAYLLKKFITFDNAMERTQDVVGYVALACFLGSTVNAVFNVVSLAYSGAVAWDDLFGNTLEWWVPNVLGSLVVAPLIITWATPSTTRWNARLITEAIFCGAGLVGGTLISFNSWYVYGIQNYPMAYLPFPFLVWSALRFGQRGATTGTLLVAVLAIYSLLHGTGPFVTNSVKDSLMLMGSYIGILAITNMLLAAAAAARRTAERAVSESEKRFRAVVENQTDLICRFNPDGCLTFVNDVFCQSHGKNSAELLGTNFFQTLSDPHAALALNYINSLPADESAVSFDLSSQVMAGQVVWQQYRVRRLFQEQGDTREYQAVIQDITKRKQLESQLLQSQKLETVGRLAGGVAHEFNSIMTAIIGQSELLLKDLPAGSLWCNNATEIRKAAERAAILTRQLLAYGRKQMLQPEILDLNTVLAGMESTLRHLMGRGTEVSLAPAVGLKAVKADAGQIEQVIINLAINAADAMPKGGALTLETANVTLNEEYVSHIPELKAGEYVMLAITDTGTGMSEDVKARVFEPFFTTKGVGQGAGLGLPTCYGIIKQSGGHISIHSELGRGTTVKIYIPPVELQTSRSGQRLAVPDLTRGTETILLVLDDLALREMAAAMLSRLGYTVFVAANGTEALSLERLADLERIDLLFTEVQMPQMSGKELTERVLALHPQTRILFTSGDTENARIQPGSHIKGAGFLQKPFTPSALALKLREMLGESDMLKSDPVVTTSGSHGDSLG
ncbi:MAG: MASE1 domain-containing protein [Verrucomicrobiota bacterium]